MLKYTGIIIIYISILSLASLHAEVQNNVSPGTERSYSIKTEITEWGIYSSLYAAGYMFQKHEPYFDEPLIGGETDKKYKKDTVPDWWLQIWMGGVYGYITFLPNDKGFMNRVTYINIKGFFEAVGYSYFVTSSTKVIVGRKRPSYDNYPESEKEDAGRKSFISNHSSMAFVIATYSSLYIYEHTGDNSNPAYIALKSAAITASLGAAGFTAWSRVNDNRHHVSDVLAGSAAGIISGLAGYIHQNGWLSWAGTGGDFSLLPVFYNDEALLALIKKF